MFVKCLYDNFLYTTWSGLLKEYKGIDVFTYINIYMKKILPLLFLSFFLVGCTSIKQTDLSDEPTSSSTWIYDLDQNEIESNSVLPSWWEAVETWTFVLNKTSSYSFSDNMLKPELSEMSNWNSILNGFKDKWKNSFEFTKEEIDLNQNVWKESCKDWITIYALNSENKKTIQINKIKPWLKVELSSQYQWEWIWLDISKNQKESFSKRGWLVIEPNSRFLESLNNYTNDSEWTNEERVSACSRIWWSAAEYQRYPYNTLFVTSDLLLHVYHKLFDNALKYYEESKIRPVVKTFSQNMLTKFANLSANTKDPELRRYYDFLSAYRMVPSIILIPQKTIEAKITNPETWVWEDLSDEAIAKIIQDRTKEFLQKYPNQYSWEIQESINQILKWMSSNTQDVLLVGFVKDLDPNFSIKQDYTQFVPRSHYRDSSLLKTYFMSMKWLMREKLYFSQMDTAKASLIMVNNISDQELQGINSLQSFVKSVVWQDDDVNVQDIKWFLTKENLTKDIGIAKNLSTKQQDVLYGLRPQKIISTSYTTPQVAMVTENEAKDKTAGFVFFGEKFTIDSWIFDQLTAGSAEKEIWKKPEVQTSLSVIDILTESSRATELVNERFDKNKKQFAMIPSQIESYPDLKQEARGKVNDLFSLGTVYGKRLDMLSFNMVMSANSPYFMTDKKYQDKTLNTYLWSYTELKHDTLLYVKQAYAEMGAWWWDACSYVVLPPVLPVPKWYVEPNLDLIDRLSELTKYTNKYFPESENFKAFQTYLDLVKKIAQAQLKNEKVSDEDFEKLRLWYVELWWLVYPQKLIWIPGEKEARSSIIADIFTSGKYGPLYEAVGRPYLMMLMVNDANGSRVVIWPVYSTYEFYGEPFPAQKWRYSDEDWQSAYDSLQNKGSLYSLPMLHLLENTK